MDSHLGSLSEQAISILVQFIKSGGTDLIYHDYGPGQTVFQIDNLCTVQFTEREFLQDDLTALVAQGLLRVEPGRDGLQIYHVTRRTKSFLTGLTPPIAPGSKFGRWTLQRPLGQGGNGLVWAATSGAEQAAIKFLKHEYLGQQREKRFRDEIEFLRREGNRPGILPLIDYHGATADGPNLQPWFATPLAQCFTSLNLAQADNLITLVTHIQLIAETLAKLHQEQKWHRDLKPENLFLLDGVPVIGDFGLVDYPDKESNTRESENLGSRNYTAPELEGGAADVPPGPADVYSLAKTLWTLASGKPHPPPGELRMDSDHLRFAAICPHPRSSSLSHLIERCTTHSPLNRPTMEAFASELSNWLRPPKPQPQADTAISSDYKALFELERRAREAKEVLPQAAAALLESFDHVLRTIAQIVQENLRVKAIVGPVDHLEHEELPAFFQAPQVVWRGAHGIRVTFGADFLTHSLQTFVQSEAIDDDTIRIVVGHFVERMARGHRLAYGVRTIWKDEARSARGSAELENSVARMSVGLKNNIGVAMQAIAEAISQSKRTSQ